MSDTLPASVAARSLGIGNAIFKDLDDGELFRFAGSDALYVKNGKRYRDIGSMTFYRTGSRSAVFRTRQKEATKVCVVDGEHFHVPGRPRRLFSSREGANAYAAELVNELLEWVQLKPIAKASNWEAQLARARNKRGRDFGCEPDELGEDNGDVWIEEEEVHP